MNINNKTKYVQNNIYTLKIKSDFIKICMKHILIHSCIDI